LRRKAAAPARCCDGIGERHGSSDQLGRRVDPDASTKLQAVQPGNGAAPREAHSCSPAASVKEQTPPPAEPRFITVEMRIIWAPDDLPQLFRAGFLGNRDAELLTFSIAGWLRRAAPGTAALCAACDAEFTSASLPRAFAIALPFFAAGGAPTITTGVCGRCAARAGTLDGLYEIALRNWRRLYPDAQFAEGSRA
jgi:hypothetical protein